MTVEQIIEKILDITMGDVRISPTADRLMAGNMEAEVSGIVTTFIATPEVINKAYEKGANLIITHEPTWFTGKDDTDWCKNDSVYLKKKALIEKKEMNIWRFHDHMHAAKNDLIYAGIVSALGWEDYKITDTHIPLSTNNSFIDSLSGEMIKWCYDIPQKTIRELANEIKAKLGMTDIRLIGKPDSYVKRAGILVGGGSLGLGHENMPMLFMEAADIDVMLCGDIIEWTLCSYVNDASQLGLNKNMLILGHERSEEPGMEYLAKWLSPLFPDILVNFISAREPFQYL